MSRPSTPIEGRIWYDCEGCGDVVEALGRKERPDHCMCYRCAEAQGYRSMPVSIERTYARGWIRGKPPQLQRELRRLATTTPAG